MGPDVSGIPREYLGFFVEKAVLLRVVRETPCVPQETKDVIASAVENHLDPGDVVDVLPLGMLFAELFEVIGDTAGLVAVMDRARNPHLVPIIATPYDQKH